MKYYKVFLNRVYTVNIKANNKEDAQRYSEFFIGNCNDCSTIQEQEKGGFEIKDIKLSLNEAFEVAENKENC